MELQALKRSISGKAQHRAPDSCVMAKSNEIYTKRNRSVLMQSIDTEETNNHPKSAKVLAGQDQDALKGNLVV